jgi:Rod binding domain-containing protein
MTSNPFGNQYSVALPPSSVDWARPSATPSLSRGAKAAREFESFLVGSLLESLEKTFATIPGDTDVPGQDEYSYLGRQALASAVTAAGGFGIAKMIQQHLSPDAGASASAVQK